MKVLIEAPFTINNADEKWIKEQVEGLSKLNDRMTQAEVYFKLDDGTIANGVMSEIRLFVPGKDAFASNTASDFKDAFSGALDKVKRQLKKAKGKNTDYA